MTFRKTTRARVLMVKTRYINGYINFGVFDKFKSAGRVFSDFFFVLFLYIYILYIILYTRTNISFLAYGGNLFFLRHHSGEDRRSDTQVRRVTL